MTYKRFKVQGQKNQFFKFDFIVVFQNIFSCKTLFFLRGLRIKQKVFIKGKVVIKCMAQRVKKAVPL
mgnify:CR=1 FL=1|jgi:hypothetical protein